MKCTWTAESSRMKGSVQLGLLCFGLLISSLHGEVETDNSMELVLNLEEPDLYQPEMNRVRRQTVSTEKEDSAKKEVVVPSSVYRTKRQNKSKNKPKKRPGFNSLLGKGPQLHMVFSIL
ncbi:uncharacterized protein si:ch211-106h4.12 isoform X2 [Rhinichthys klamathensis goyatoka]|uniref:uncharacterized protein si:ch211-106h4.12 isoform X2 n=1 Tax=Rhinichthys klamathensis goyatoka TaxID=3034132 RepID=UPI0024B4B7D4|nr:uncharacterized protein si:ch211-106h4.12 isoform X2 [Rhinichthys klamathensis goyatoka]